MEFLYYGDTTKSIRNWTIGLGIFTVVLGSLLILTYQNLSINNTVGVMSFLVGLYIVFVAIKNEAILTIGKNSTKIWIGVILGLSIVGFYYISGLSTSYSIALPYSSIGVNNIVGDAGYSPLAEEFVFMGLLFSYSYYLLYRATGSKFISFMITFALVVGGFGLFHLGVYGANGQQIFSVEEMRSLICLGFYFTDTLVFGFIVHSGGNLFALHKQGFI